MLEFTIELTTIDGTVYTGWKIEINEDTQLVSLHLKDTPELYLQPLVITLKPKYIWKIEIDYRKDN